MENSTGDVVIMEEEGEEEEEEEEAEEAVEDKWNPVLKPSVTVNRNESERK